MKHIAKRTSLFLTGVLLFACAGNLRAQQTLSLDGVITQAAKDIIATRLSAGAKLAVLNFTSTAEAFSDYVIEELSGALVMNRNVTIIERRSLDLIRKEMNLQLSGDVSDDSAQAIGKQLGAQAIVTGSLTNLGDTYRFRVKVINVETARIEAQFSYNLGNNPQVAFLLSGSQNAPSISSVSPGSSGAAATVQTNKVYKIGDTGPAGGIIFYVNPQAGEWKYLEAAPVETEEQAQWGAMGSRVGGTTSAVGTGKQNTTLILRFLKAYEETGRASQICDALSHGGYDDWFLPSKDELALMYTVLAEKGLDVFHGSWYWSSSQVSADGAWVQAFSTGEQSNDDGSYYFGSGPARKDQNRRVRAVRQF